MQEKRKPVLKELEDNVMLVPLFLSVVLTLVSFALQLFGEAAISAKTFCVQASYYVFAWYICIALSCCIRDGKYISLRVISDLFPKSLQKGIAIINELLELFVIIIMFVFSFVIVKMAVTEKLMNPAVPSVPVVVAYFAPIVGFALSILRKIERFFKEGIYQ